jgi:hemerythrin
MHPLLEKEHQKLIDLIDTLDKCVLNGNSMHEVTKHLDAFVKSAEDEFQNEERIMEAYQYPEIIDHKKEHVRLLEQLHSVHIKLSKGHTPFGKDYMRWLRNWMETHLLDTDKRLEEFLYKINAGSKK